MASNNAPFKHGDRVELTIDMEELRAGMKGKIHVSVGQKHVGVLFDWWHNPAFTREVNNEIVNIIDHVKLIPDGNV